MAKTKTATHDNLFLSVASVGTLDTRDKRRNYVSFKGFIKTEQDKQLQTLVPNLIDIILGYLPHTNDQAAQKDLKQLKAIVKDIKLIKVESQ